MAIQRQNANEFALIANAKIARKIGTRNYEEKKKTNGEKKYASVRYWLHGWTKPRRLWTSSRFRIELHKLQSEQQSATHDSLTSQPLYITFLTYTYDCHEFQLLVQHFWTLNIFALSAGKKGNEENERTKKKIEDGEPKAKPTKIKSDMNFEIEVYVLDDFKRAHTHTHSHNITEHLYTQSVFGTSCKWLRNGIVLCSISSMNHDLGVTKYKKSYE